MPEFVCTARGARRSGRLLFFSPKRTILKGIKIFRNSPLWGKPHEDMCHRSRGVHWFATGRKTGRAGPEVRAFLRYNSKNSWGWLEESEYAKEMEIVSGISVISTSFGRPCMAAIGSFTWRPSSASPIPTFLPLAYVKTNVEGTYTSSRPPGSAELSG